MQHSPLKETTLNMRTFAEAFFTRFGAEVLPGDDDILIILPPHLTKLFGKPKLYLVFADEETGSHRPLSPTEDLLVYGSRTFDTMMALLADRDESSKQTEADEQTVPTGHGEAAQLSFPVRASLELDLTWPLFTLWKKPQLIETNFETKNKLFYLFHFRAIYTWAEKEEEFITIALDEDGEFRPDKNSHLSNGSVFLAPDPPLAFDSDTLHRFFDHSQQLALRHAQKQADEIEKGIKNKLQKTIFRLNKFYKRLTDDIKKGDTTEAEKAKADLDIDLKRKMADELERNALQITLVPLSYAMIQVPMGHHHLTLKIKNKEISLILSRDLYSNQVEHYTCQTCQQPIKTLAFRTRDDILPPACDDNCPLRNHRVAQSCLEIVALPITATNLPSNIPVSDNFDPQKYDWLHIEDTKHNLYFGQRQGPKIFTPFFKYNKTSIMVLKK